MTNKEILEKAIEKAIERGWEPRHFVTLKNSYSHPEDSEFLDPLGRWHTISPLDIIYNHQFAKALWGEETIYVSLAGQYESDVPLWQYHLQQMVISPDPIQYLGENL